MAQHEVKEEHKQQHQQAHQPQSQQESRDNIANAPRSVIEIKPTLTLGLLSCQRPTTSTRSMFRSDSVCSLANSILSPRFE